MPKSCVNVIRRLWTRILCRRTIAHATVCKHLQTFVSYRRYTASTCYTCNMAVVSIVARMTLLSPHGKCGLGGDWRRTVVTQVTGNDSSC